MLFRSADLVQKLHLLISLSLIPSLGLRNLTGETPRYDNALGIPDSIPASKPISTHLGIKSLALCGKSLIVCSSCFQVHSDRGTFSLQFGVLVGQLDRLLSQVSEAVLELLTNQSRGCH